MLPLLLALSLAAPGPSPEETPSEDTPPENASPDTTAFRLADHQWRHRVLVVFAPSRDDARRQAQAVRIEAAQAGFVERDLIVVTVTTDGPSRAQPTPTDAPAPMPAADAEALRARFDVPPDAFRVVLVGKDGTAKRRDEAPVAPADLFATIDAMPMRQREMREDDGG
jgi:hypothetical protein